MRRAFTYLRVFLTRRGHWRRDAARPARALPGEPTRPACGNAPRNCPRCGGPVRCFPVDGARQHAICTRCDVPIGLFVALPSEVTR